MNFDGLIRPLAFFSGLAQRCTFPEFAERFQGPVLVLQPHSVPEDDTRFETVQAGSGRGGVSLVVPISKRAGANHLGSMITVGRAGNNDIELGAPSVSKFHGYFVVEQNGDVVFADGNSSGGSWVDGERLGEGERRQVPVGATLRFGKLEATLCDPELLYNRALQAADES